MTVKNGETFLTVKELSQRWKISEQRLNQLRYEGSGVKYVKIGGAVRYRLSDIIKYEAKNVKE